MPHRCRSIPAVCTALALLLTACSPLVVTVTVTAPPETVVVTATPPPSPLEPPRPPKTLTVCLVGEPDTLYLYGGSRLPATRHVMEALYDGPVDYVNYEYRPVILEHIPTLRSGDVVTRVVTVRAGDRVVNTLGEVVELAKGVRVRPASCHSAECEVVSDGGPLKMERIQVVFTLRKDVTWADGKPLTAADSLFAYQVASDPATPGYRYLTSRTAIYQQLDDWRVQWVGIPGFVPTTYFLSFFPPLPRHQLEGRNPARLTRAEETRQKPLGWGPFVVKEWVAGDHLTLTRNPRYFRAGEGLPRLEQVVFRFTSGAEDTVARIIAGECDLGVHDADFDASMPLLIQAERQNLLKVVSTVANGWEHIDFGVRSAEDYRRPNFFGDVLVRQAIAQCIDREAVMEEATYGRSVVPDSYLPPSHPLYAGVYLLHWGYDPSAGRALLEQAGWTDKDGDGVREAVRVQGVPNGAPFEVSLLISSDKPVAEQIGRIIKAYLADCGIRVTLDPRPSWQFFADGPEGPLFGRQFDLAEAAWWFDDTPLCGHYISSEIPDAGNKWYGGNVTGYSNPAYDAACQAALTALPGAPDYEEYHKQAQIIFSEELPAIPLFMWLRVAVIRSNVLNFELDPISHSELWSIETLDVAEESP